VFCTLVVSVGLMYRKLHWRINVMKRRKWCEVRCFHLVMWIAG
jgi:hypothetical protein